jgi:PAS domain S-box-containing protein
MLGYTREEFLKLTFQDMTHHEDLAADLELLTQTLQQQRNTYSIEKRYIHKDGAIVYGLLNVSLIRDTDNSPLYFISQINDITQRVIVEQELQESLNELESFLKATTQVAIIQADVNGTIIKYNKGAENLLGYTPQDLIGKHTVGVFHVPEEVEKRGRELEEKYGRPFSGFDIFTFKPKQGKFDAREWTFIRKDGSRFTVHLVITSVLDHKGEITGYLGIATDISRLKEMETSLLLARDKAEAANRSKSEFLANMSHEIRTPLNGVIGFTDLLMKTELTENQRKYMQMANTSAHSLLDIINDILDFSKIEAGKLELNYEKTDIIELCSQTIDIIKHQAHAKSLEILLDISPDINRFVYADSVRLRQIIVNLLGNAVKFTTEGEVELKVRTLPAGNNEGEMIFSFAIRDTGIGIAPQNLEKIFNAFDQEDASTTRRYGGTGLGITISNRLLSLMGSSLHVESELHKGSTFSFKIKFRVETDDRRNQVKVNIKNVLIVDDNANNLIILKDMLAAKKISTTLASNSIEALEILENNSFDLAIIDYNMPYLNGIELVTQIRQTLNLDAEALPVMLLHSSTDDEKLIQASIDLDIRFNVTKPIISDQLFAFLDNIHRTHNEEVALLAEADKTEGFDAPFVIMVAEDNPVNQMLTKTIIQQITPQAIILLAENGREAVEMFEKKVPDIIFMDIQMPEMSGFEATEKIREIEQNGAHLPIVALTARALVGEREECLRLGMDDYITKPIVFETLKAVIEKYLVRPYNLNRND